MPECQDCGNKTSFERKVVVDEWDQFDPETGQHVNTEHTEYGGSLTIECECGETHHVSQTGYTCTECGSDNVE